ncbi:MAG: hypothetical protein JO112_01620 [Planctomycetes bacterium]|nr:hypothetical protein [Planctomycetota bacterium]
MRLVAVLLLFVTGCSTAPVADLLDFFAPGRLKPGDVAPYGGVCAPVQVGPPGSVLPAPVAPGPVLPAAPVPSGPVVPVPPPGEPPPPSPPFSP